MQGNIIDGNKTRAQALCVVREFAIVLLRNRNCLNFRAACNEGFSTGIMPLCRLREIGAFAGWAELQLRVDWYNRLTNVSIRERVIVATKSQGKHTKNSNNYKAGNGVSGTSATPSGSASEFDRAAVREESGFAGANGGRATSVLPPVAKGAAYGDGQVYASDYPEYASAYGNPGGTGMGAVNSAGQFDMGEPKKKRNAGKILGIVFGSIAGVLLLAYVIGIVIFSNLFYPGTSIGSIDASMKSNADVKQELESAVSNYKLTVSGDGFSYTIDTAQADVSIDADAIVSQMHESLPAWQWPYLLTKSQHALTDLFVTSYAGSSSLNSAIKAKVDEFNATATEPQNASIVYDSAKKQFVVKEEVAGTQLDADAVTKLVDQAILSFQSKATLGSDQLLKPTENKASENGFS
jgi:hypothetical protein